MGPSGLIPHTRCVNRRIHVIGIGAGDPDYVTVQAVAALNDTQVFFVMDKGETKAVFEVQPGQTVRAGAVVAGPSLGNLISLRQGRAAGTRIVRSPPANMKDGMRIKEKQ